MFRAMSTIRYKGSIPTRFSPGHDAQRTHRRNPLRSTHRCALGRQLCACGAGAGRAGYLWFDGAGNRAAHTGIGVRLALGAEPVASPRMPSCAGSNWRGRGCAFGRELGTPAACSTVYSLKSRRTIFCPYVAGRSCLARRSPLRVPVPALARSAYRPHSGSAS